jgi:hypothetical protein
LKDPKILLNLRQKRHKENNTKAHHKNLLKLGVGAHACNPAYLEAEIRGIIV